MLLHEQVDAHDFGRLAKTSQGRRLMRAVGDEQDLSSHLDSRATNHPPP
jgi:hypothetical protein